MMKRESLCRNENYAELWYHGKRVRTPIVCYDVHFWTNALGKGMISFILPELSFYKDSFVIK